jgi:hypothetical protein
LKTRLRYNRRKKLKPKELKYYQLKVKFNNYNSELLFFGLSRKTITRSFKIIIITLEIGNIIYLEKAFAIYSIQLEVKGREKLKRGLLQVKPKFHENSKDNLFAEFGNNLRSFGEKIYSQCQKIKEAKERIKTFTGIASNARLRLEHTMQEYVSKEDTPNNQEIEKLVNPLVSYRIFRRTVRSPGDSSQFSIDFQKNIHAISKQFNRITIDSFGRFTNVKNDNVGTEKIKTDEMEKRELNPSFKSFNRSIVLMIFNEFYSMIIYNENKIGDLRKTLGVWMDLSPTNVIISTKKRY